MKRSNYQNLSVYLSFLLRHGPETLQLAMDKQGFVDVAELIDAINKGGQYAISKELLDRIVKDDSKGRYRYNADGTKIKAYQGHSVPWVEPELTMKQPPAVLYHGTTLDAYEEIIASGAISKMNRHAVHLQDDEDKAWQAAKRWKKPCVEVKIDSAGMFADGYEFGVSENGVWLVKSVPTGYINEVLSEEKKMNNTQDRLYDLYQEATAFFEAQLNNETIGAESMSFLLEKKDYTMDTIRTFRLGFAPSESEACINYLRKCGFNDTEIISSELAAVNKDGSLKGIFQNRIIIPITNADGRTISFCGRRLDKSCGAVFIFLPNTAIFKKEDTVFALHQAKNHCQEKIVLCEEVMDAICLYNAGCKNAVSLVGVSSLSLNQARQMTAYTSGPIHIFYDNDTSGIDAAEKAWELLHANGIDCIQRIYPGIKDPLDFIDEYGIDELLGE